MSEIMILIWFGVIILAAFIEITTMDLTSVWFSIGAVFSFVLAILNVAIGWQIAQFLISYHITVFFKIVNGGII